MNRLLSLLPALLLAALTTHAQSMGNARYSRSGQPYDGDRAAITGAAPAGDQPVTLRVSGHSRHDG